MERDVPFDLLHHLMNVAVQNGHRAEALQVAERLRTVLRTPAPFRIYGPQRNMRKHDHRAAGRLSLEVGFQPLQLVGPQFAKPFECGDVGQSDEVDVFVVEAIPPAPFCVLPVALHVLLPSSIEVSCSPGTK